MSPADKKRVIPQPVADFFVRYGAGSHFVQAVTKSSLWNLISWILIVVGIAGWIVFLMWKP